MNFHRVTYYGFFVVSIDFFVFSKGKILKQLYYLNIDTDKLPSIEPHTKQKLRFIIDILYDEFVGYKTKSSIIIKQLEKNDEARWHFEKLWYNINCIIMSKILSRRKLYEQNNNGRFSQVKFMEALPVLGIMDHLVQNWKKISKMLGGKNSSKKKQTMSD